jgi:hypothetical protein
MFAKSVLVAALAAASLAASSAMPRTADAAVRRANPRTVRLTLHCRTETGSALYRWVPDVQFGPVFWEGTIRCGESVETPVRNFFGQTIIGAEASIDVDSVLCITGVIEAPGHAKCHTAMLKVN